MGFEATLKDKPKAEPPKKNKTREQDSNQDVQDMIDSLEGIKDKGELAMEPSSNFNDHDFELQISPIIDANKKNQEHLRTDEIDQYFQ